MQIAPWKETWVCWGGAEAPASGACSTSQPAVSRDSVRCPRSLCECCTAVVLGTMGNTRARRQEGNARRQWCAALQHDPAALYGSWVKRKISLAGLLPAVFPKLAASQAIFPGSSSYPTEIMAVLSMFAFFPLIFIDCTDND